MERIEIELDEETLARARKLAEARRCSLDELLKAFIQQEAKPTSSVDTILGMCADEPELLDEVVESAMQARERDDLCAAQQIVLACAVRYRLPELRCGR